MEWDTLKFRKMFPNLYKELENCKIPTVLNHLEVCSNLREAIEIIEYFEKIGEITPEFAKYLKSNISELNIIGTRKRGDYERDGI